MVQASRSVTGTAWNSVQAATQPKKRQITGQKAESSICLIEEKPTFAEPEPSLSPTLHTTNLLQHIKNDYGQRLLHGIFSPSAILQTPKGTSAVGSSDLERDQRLLYSHKVITDQIQLLYIT